MTFDGKSLQVNNTLEFILKRLTEEMPALSQAVADDVHKELPSYRIYGEAAANRAVHKNVEAAIQALRSRRPYPDDHFAAIDETIRERFEASIPIHEVVRAFTLCIRRIHQKVLEVGKELLVAGDDAIEASDILWRLSDAITARVVTTYNELDVQSSLIDLQRRATLIRRLVTGKTTRSELDPSVFDLGGSYAAVRCMVEGGVGMTARASLEESGSCPDRRAVLALIDGECVGIVAKKPDPIPGMVIGMGPFGPLAEIPSSFTVADKACHVAHHLRRRGIHTLDTLSWRFAAVSEPQVNALLRERYVAPLRSEGEFGADIEKSVRRFLSHGQNIGETARSLTVHPNTLRYRLRRFAELTGADLDSQATLLEISWALQLGSMPKWVPRF